MRGHLGRTIGLRVRAGTRMSSDSVRRAGLTMTDQCVASLSNFAVGVAVARIAGVAGLGAFALAYAGWITLNNVHRSLITDPMAIHRDAHIPDAARRFREGFAAELVLGLSVSIGFAFVGGILVIVGEHTYGIGLLAAAPWLIFLDLQDYWRWIGFMQGKPGKSLANDIVFACAQGLGIVVVLLTGLHSSAAMISAWGFGALAGSLFGLWQFSVRPAVRGGISMIRERWHMSKWLVANSLTNSGTGQVNLIIVAAILGPIGLGGLTASQNLVSGPSAVVIHASGSLGLPEASRALEQRGWLGLNRVTRLMSGAALVSVGIFGVAILIAGGELLRLFYGPAFVDYAPAARLLAIAFIINAVGIGPILALKATKQTRSLLNTQIVNFVISVPLVAVLGLVFGVKGAAAAALFYNSATLAALLLYQRKARRSLLGDSHDPTSQLRAGLDASRRSQP